MCLEPRPTDATNVIKSVIHNGTHITSGLFSVPAPPFRLAASGGVFSFFHSLWSASLTAGQPC
jgi:hypothetical protein